ncbi:MAG: hypothetical protein MZV64_17605 [Ignavibacteriales bacterium]|nr:hypothetical protein [Ignavibacteriales bacterium]
MGSPLRRAGRSLDGTAPRSDQPDAEIAGLLRQLAKIRRTWRRLWNDLLELKPHVFTLEDFDLYTSAGVLTMGKL